MEANPSNRPLAENLRRLAARTDAAPGFQTLAVEDFLDLLAAAMDREDFGGLVLGFGGDSGFAGLYIGTDAFGAHLDSSLLDNLGELIPRGMAIMQKVRRKVKL